MKLMLKCLALICILQINIFIISAINEKDVKKSVMKRNESHQGGSKSPSLNSAVTSSNDASNAANDPKSPPDASTAANNSKSPPDASNAAKTSSNNSKTPATSTNTKAPDTAKAASSNDKNSADASNSSANLANAKATNTKSANTAVKKSPPSSSNSEKSNNKKATNTKLVVEQENLGNCYINIDNFIYDLTPLNKVYDSNYTIKSSKDKTITFDFCRDISTKCPKSNALVVGEDCEKLSGSASTDKKWIVEKDGEVSKLVLQLADGDNCSKVTYEIVCKPDIILDIQNNGEIDTTQCGKVIKMESKYACPASEYKPWEANIKLGKTFIVSILGLVGIFFLIFGSRYSSFTLTLILGACLSFILWILLKNTLKIHLGGFFIIGYLLAVLIPMIDDKEKSLHKLSSILIIGFIGGSIVYAALVASVKINPEVLYWGSFSAVCIVSLVLWAVIGKHIISLSTSMVGAYLIVRALGIYFDNYPDEILMSNLIKNREHNQLRRKFSRNVIIYLSAMVGLCVVGTIIQSSSNKEDDSKKEENPKPVENSPVVDTPTNNA